MRINQQAMKKTSHMTETVIYPCGCSATGTPSLPRYCPTHPIRLDLRELVQEASEIMQITYAGNFPAGIESFLTRADLALKTTVPPQPSTVPLLDALKAARDVVVALANQAGIVPGQHGYSSVQTDTERKAWQAVSDIDALLAAACLDSQGRTP